MEASIVIRPMTRGDIGLIYEGLSGHDVGKPQDYIERCWEENQKGERFTLLALHEHDFAGWGHVVYISHYPYFAENEIPEIQNFDVIPPFRRRGIGGRLIEALEAQAYEGSGTVGIGFGLYADYGSAQRLYVKRGYVPDGKGVMYGNRPVEPGGQVRVDDDLVLYLTKAKGKMEGDAGKG
ncbi:MULTISPECIES: GNAT family N-acetyltransferase [unclassified Paenibacillus]|uniref:GNAT family N-acetyltransferase n=1 Tax=unclassified Paenibacillus TaxID=185978 RepID=UPI0009547251|nr:MULTISPECIES: GNAT family N-acetyltransferase [unclassified Paenibacillus]ASS68060.1 GNAT family N-acetyltransferase [Paenibacillus sp. RUD330]SIR40201.1 Acetyltransferase (GNAT) domain-containing protein [Paenibacillus sp. RU4X]SIR50432.1 Acetyltransferase (GNAT) domain-containing protein [Paenibacillus sp. RU4T]